MLIGIALIWGIGVGASSLSNGLQSNTISVTLEDTAKANEIISVMTGNSASSTSGPSLGFTTATKDQLEKDLKLEAVTDAKGQAVALSQKAGSKLGKVVSIQSGSGISYPSVQAFESVSSVMSAPAKSVSSDINVGDKEISVTISVTYRLK